MTLTEALKSIYPAGRTQPQHGFAVGERVRGMLTGALATVVSVEDGAAAFPSRKPEGWLFVRRDDDGKIDFWQPANAKRVSPQGYAVGDEVEVDWNGGWRSWEAATVVAPENPFSGHVTITQGEGWMAVEPHMLRRPQRTASLFGIDTAGPALSTKSMGPLTYELMGARKRIAEGSEQLAKPLVAPEEQATTSNRLTFAKRDGKPPETFGYEVGDEVEVDVDEWYPARVLAPNPYTVGVCVALVGGKYDGHKQVFHPGRVRRRDVTPLNANEQAVVAMAVEALLPPAAPLTRCPRCHGPRDAEPRAHIHLCGCLVKWDVEARQAEVDAVGEPHLSRIEERGEMVWCAFGRALQRSIEVTHPLRDTAVALWRREAWESSR